MGKHIKIEGKLVKDEVGRHYVRVTILKRTHAGASFGVAGDARGLQGRFTHNNLLLYSNSGPNTEFYRDHATAIGFNNARKVPTNSITLSVSEFDRLKEAVIAYNEYFKDKD